MNKNIFNSITPDRRNTSSLKFDGMKSIFGHSDLEPFWVADMDFCAPQAVFDAIKSRLNHEMLGYPIADVIFFESISSWFYKRFGVNVETNSIVPMTGVVASMFTAILAFSEHGDGVVVQPPVYGPFFGLINSSKRKLIENPLLIGVDGYEIDFDSLETLFLEKSPKILLFCSPHNPVGRVWRHDELVRLSILCKQYSVMIVSDEIHFDLVFPPHKHTTFLSIKDALDNLILLSAPTKTFNIPGLNISYAIIPNRGNRTRFENLAKSIHQASPNIFGLEALKACYANADEWLGGALLYLLENRGVIDSFVENNDFVQAFSPEGTYLYWLDFRNSGLNKSELSKRIQNAGLALSSGDFFFNGKENQFFRFNFATNRSMIEFALNRLKECFKTHPNG